MREASREDAPSAEHFRIVLTECPTGAEVTTETGNIDETHAEMAQCCGDGVDMRVSAEVEDADSCDEPEAQPEEKRTRRTRRSTIPPRIRRAVLHRDGRACVVKGCPNRLWMDLHHVTPQAHGGGHTEDNLVTLCSPHTITSFTTEEWR